MIYPPKIKVGELPLIVLSDDRRSFLSWVIKAHSHGNYSHIMEMVDIGYFASQHFTGYKEIPVEKYMKSYITLKFWRVDLTPSERTKWEDAVKADLDAPWLNRRYDFLGIIGQLFRIPKLQNSFTKYCGERISKRLNYVLDADFPSQTTPSELNEIFKTDDRFSVVGYYFMD